VTAVGRGISDATDPCQSQFHSRGRRFGPW